MAWRPKNMFINKKYTSKHSISALYNAWVSPEMTIPPVTKIEVDLRIGGRFVLHSKMQETTSIMRGKFLQIAENKKLVYIWHWEGSEETSVVTVEFIENTGQNIIKINHIGFLTQESQKNHSVGWDFYIEELEKRLSLK